MDNILPQIPRKNEQKSFGWFSILLLASILVVGTVIGIQLANQLQTQPTSGPAPDFELTTFDGETFNLSDLRGQVVVLNFWASWCVPCRDEAPILESLWRRYRSQRVVVVGVAYADSQQGSLEFIEEFNISYPNGPDVGTRISDEYRITGVPETFVINEAGEIVFFIPAPISEGQLDAIIRPLLAKS